MLFLQFHVECGLGYGLHTLRSAELMESMDESPMKLRGPTSSLLSAMLGSIVGTSRRRGFTVGIGNHNSWVISLTCIRG